MLKSVIHGFLGTYVSRYSDFDGYLLFGFVVDSLGLVEIDLTESESASPVRTPHSELIRLARQKFKEQLSKVGLPTSVGTGRDAEDSQGGAALGQVLVGL